MFIRDEMNRVYIITLLVAGKLLIVPPGERVVRSSGLSYQVVDMAGSKLYEGRG